MKNPNLSYTVLFSIKKVLPEDHYDRLFQAGINEGRFSAADRLPVVHYRDLMNRRPRPCFDPVQRGLCTTAWHGTATDVLLDPRLDLDDKLWFAFDEQALPAEVLHGIALWMADEALGMIPYPRQECIDAINAKRAALASDDPTLYLPDRSAMTPVLDEIHPLRKWVAEIVWAAVQADPGTAAAKAYDEFSSTIEGRRGFFMDETYQITEDRLADYYDALFVKLLMLILDL